MAINQKMLVHYNFDEQVLDILPFDGADCGISIGVENLVAHGRKSYEGEFSGVEDFESSLSSLAALAREHEDGEI